jgi:hypothetical protein
MSIRFGREHGSKEVLHAHPSSQEVCVVRAFVAAGLAAAAAIPGS